MPMRFGPRRGTYIDISRELRGRERPLTKDELRCFERFDLIYRSLCALLFNYVPLSGHPGGSISSGRIVAGILFDAMDYDLSNPDREDADLISYAAGHKALGLYAMWAMRNEIARVAAPDLLPSQEALQFRLEDLLGFRRNPVTKTPLFLKYHSKPLDGHPTPATPFVRLSTGASGVGVASSMGLAFGALDYYGEAAPRVHIVEGEGGLTPGRVSETLAAAGTASLKNAVMHIDWNQSSIDSDRVCREGETPGEYVQWTPMELAYMHDWNVIYVARGMNLQHILAAQRRVASIENGQPTAIVYRTTKGWKYGIEGRGSHGAGHALCSNGFYTALRPLMRNTKVKLPKCDDDRCGGGKESDLLEECLWEALEAIRGVIEQSSEMATALGQRLSLARQRLDSRSRRPRPGAPEVSAIYSAAAAEAASIPQALRLEPGAVTTLRGELGRVLDHFNRAGNGAILVGAADLLASTSVNTGAGGFADGYYNSMTNPEARTLSMGGICEDAMAGIFSGLTTYGRHIGVGSSYGAFIAPLSHVAARLHAIGAQARQTIADEPYKPMIVVCAHAGVKTGEDGPTHADPQPLQLLQENFPQGTAITLTPWDPQEMWPLVSAALARRPAVITPFVTRPNETILDRASLGLAPATAASTGVYLLKAAEGESHGTLVLQGSDVAYAFVGQALPLLEQKGIRLNVYYVASAELFDLLPEAEKESIFPARLGDQALGITGFTLPTMYRWIRSEKGRKMTLHPFKKGHFLGSGQAHMVLAEAGLDGESQFKAIVEYLDG